MERPYVSLGETDRLPREEHYDAVQLLVINTLRKFTSEILDAAAKASATHELLASQEVMDKAYFTSLYGNLRLMGTAEAAEYLGVRRQRVYQLDSTKNFPAPVARLAGGPVWLAEQIERFKETWERKPGRPGKTKENT